MHLVRANRLVDEFFRLASLAAVVPAAEREWRFSRPLAAVPFDGPFSHALEPRPQGRYYDERGAVTVQLTRVLRTAGAMYVQPARRSLVDILRNRPPDITHALAANTAFRRALAGAAGEAPLSLLGVVHRRPWRDKDVHVRPVLAVPGLPDEYLLGWSDEHTYTLPMASHRQREIYRF